MKHILTLSVVVCMLFAITSCKKDAKLNDIINPTASMKCKIDGTAWSAQTRVTTIQSNKVIINGTGSLGSDVLNITTFGTTTGTYNLSTTVPIQTQFSATFTNNTNSTDSLYTAYSGSVTLTKVDTVNKRISGTFYFHAKNMQLLNKTVTEGSFTDLAY